jgi:hypothetical protein
MPSIGSTFCAIAAVAIQIASAKDWDSPSLYRSLSIPFADSSGEEALEVSVLESTL